MNGEEALPGTSDRITPDEPKIERGEGRPPVSDVQLVAQMQSTAAKLLEDKANRGDIKLLNTALKELRYSFKVFAEYRKYRKVTVFGSARLPATDPSYQQALVFGRRMSEAGYMVITGAASGIMEAGHVGAGRDHSIGVNIMLPFEQAANKVIAGDKKLMHLKYFFTRKLLFVKASDAVALFPGGFGTLDEGFEVLTLVQTGKSQIFPIVMVDAPGGNYWEHVQRFVSDVLVKRRLISAEDQALYRLVDSVDEAVKEILRFYRVYHSMRYVRSDLVLRLQRELPPALLDHIRTEFTDIVISGTFEQSAALPAEANDADLSALPRLHFQFNRHSLGRLRMLIDLINREA
jgi:uncharacterized protein (TIGR00730 family)